MNLIVSKEEKKQICKEYHIPEKENASMYRDIKEDETVFYEMKPLHGKVSYQAYKEKETGNLMIEKNFERKHIKKCQIFSSRSCLLSEKLQFLGEQNQLCFRNETEISKRGIYFQGCHNELPISFHLTKQTWNQIEIYEKYIEYGELKKCLRMMQLIDNEKFYTFQHDGKDKLNGFFFHDSRREKFQKEVIKQYVPKQVIDILKENQVSMRSILYFEGEQVLIAAKQEDNIYLFEADELKDIFEASSPKMILKGDKSAQNHHRMTRSDILNIYQVLVLSEIPMHQIVCEYLKMIYESMRLNITPIYFKVPEVWSQFLKDNTFSLDILIFQLKNQLEEACRLEKLFESDITCHSGKVKKII